ncbi:MAG: S-glutathionyl-(chloro)hydroquinone reductase [Alectoria fallacina]|uniref:Glutathione S-transferase omega-like 2 n=1 Tax=Alectoria fallacina TaxID=1903189 RepID=A0A8H3PF58_9LECA|nr:MAG: S-glutathionyl-(chloro)hydroquinone reductase [Alectoria fallacina]
MAVRESKDFSVLSSSDMFYFISQVKVNRSPIGPTSRANSKEDSPNSEITSPSNQARSSPQRKADIISMSHMPVLGVPHRTLIVRNLKGLEDIVPYTSVHWEMLEKGWRFATPKEKIPGDNVTSDPIHKNFTHLQDIYFDVDADYTGRFTVPTLYDIKQHKIVSNESSEIIRMFYTEFDDIVPDRYKSVDLFPEQLRAEIESTNDWTYNDINNGVYKSGFATTQEAYEQAVKPLFASLDRAEAHLTKHAGPYYFGTNITEVDVRLYTTIIRFDPVYVQHFKCNIRDIRSGYPELHKWLRKLYWDVPAFKDTTQFEHIKNHYTKSHKQINSFSITPVGPLPDILPKDQEIPAAAAALQSMNQ